MAEPASEREARELARWQRRLLPFMIGAISLMGVFFFASSIIQLDRLGKAVSFQPSDKIEQVLSAYERRAGAQPGPPDMELLRYATRVRLEDEALRHRYAQVNATLLLRAWTRHLGFLTGMILALVGAIFILARLREETTQISGEGGGAKAALATSSPGIVLACLGTVLMVVTLTVDFQFTTTDVPVYLGAEGARAPDLGTPAPLDGDDARLSENQLFPADAQGNRNDHAPPPPR